ncbi:dihydroorotate dehydrogenase [Candidatus Micrarchaeota archaeon]|nr:dihydroorotate dehydrogenase [Candidatus Micrarchaeota archaeon]
MSIQSEFFGKKMKNPILLASGIIGMTRGSLGMACENGCGGVISKSLTLEPRKGHEGPNIVETECGILNAMGYPNPGIEEGLREFAGWKREEALVISIVGKNAGEFAELAKKVELQKNRVSALEAVISCPHTPGYGTMVGQGTPESVSEITTAIKENCSLPLIIKLSPSVPGEVKAALAAEEAGADAINMGNSLGPGMKIDIHRKKPVLGFGIGGLSGLPIKPIAVRCVYDIYGAVKIPIIGTGGINAGVDAIEMMMAGAKWVSVGTAVYYRGQDVFAKIAKEMEVWMKLNGYSRLEEITGAAHEQI